MIFLDFVICQMLDANKAILRMRTTNELVQFCLQCGTVTVLRVLNYEHHEKGNDGCASVDDELPSIGVAEERAGSCPTDDNKQGQQERNWTP